MKLSTLSQAEAFKGHTASTKNTIAVSLNQSLMTLLTLLTMIALRTSCDSTTRTRGRLILKEKESFGAQRGYEIHYNHL